MREAIVLLWLGALTVYDIGQGRLPNWLTLPGAGVILLAAVVSGRGVPALAGAAALATVYLVVHLAAPNAMGAGDVKLAIGLGALTGRFGVEVWFLAALAAPLLTAASGVVMWPRGAGGVPHGPSMCLASGLAVGLALV
jgi:leader peptidase (prepilin peptidase) / N-methyltransferase